MAEQDQERASKCPLQHENAVGKRVQGSVQSFQIRRHVKTIDTHRQKSSGWYKTSALVWS